MGYNWGSSAHPISDIRDWSNNDRLELRPDYQRNEVWSEAAKIQLIDSILRNIPIPKVYFQTIIRGSDTYRIVIDGQQRINSILSFLRDDFKLGKPYQGEFFNKKFSELPIETQKVILKYQIDTNEIYDADNEVIRDIYSRVNKYTVALNKQELRRADFPGDFLILSEQLALEPFFERAKVFTVASRRRMTDVEYISELLALLIDGPQEKKETLDGYYIDYAEWDTKDKDSVKDSFLSILSDVSLIMFPENNSSFETLHDTRELDIAKSRFRQKADFYSLFAAINELKKGGGSLEGKPLRPLIEDLILLDDNIEPESPHDKFSEYAIKCVSQGNTKGSRVWRTEFLKKLLIGSYSPSKFTEETASFLEDIYLDFLSNICDGFCPAASYTCPICGAEEDNYKAGYLAIAWHKQEVVYCISNSLRIHCKCLSDSAISEEYFFAHQSCKQKDTTPVHNPFSQTNQD